MVALVAAALGFFWLGIAPHVAVRHWVGDYNVHCRQMLNGAQQWSDPRAGGVWIADQAGSSSRC
jgi:hypothetical protein